MKFIVQFEIEAEDLEGACEIAGNMKEDAITGALTMLRHFKGNYPMEKYEADKITSYSLVKVRSVKELE